MPSQHPTTTGWEHVALCNSNKGHMRKNPFDTIADSLPGRSAPGTTRSGEFHLSREASREVVAMAIESYIARVGEPPAELFLHGRVRFNDEEWRGFIERTGGVSANRLHGFGRVMALGPFW
jgi:hypothetical protein